MRGGANRQKGTSCFVQGMPTELGSRGAGEHQKYTHTHTHTLLVNSYKTIVKKTPLTQSTVLYIGVELWLIGFYANTHTLN